MLKKPLETSLKIPEHFHIDLDNMSFTAPYSKKPPWVLHLCIHKNILTQKKNLEKIGKIFRNLDIRRVVLHTSIYNRTLIQSFLKLKTLPFEVELASTKQLCKS